MAKGILGIEALPTVTSTKPFIVPATAEVDYPNPRHDAIAIVPQFDQPPVFDDKGGFLRIKLRVNDQISMGRWNGNSFELAPGPKRLYDEQDFLTPERLAKYPGLEDAVHLLMQVIEAEAIAAGVI